MDDRAKVAKLAQTYGPRIYSLALRMCGNDADAQDVVQDTFLQAHRKWKQFRGDSDPGTWLYTIAARRCKRAYLGKRARGGAVPKYMQLVPFADRTVADVPLDEPDGVERQVRREEVEAVEQAIARLPADFRLPLVLKDVVELSLAEVGAVLGIRPETVKTRVHRARLLLRAAMMRSVRRQRPAPNPTYERSVCLDLLGAKLSAMDAGRGEALPQDVVCDRCRAVFAELDMTQAACARLSSGSLPVALRRELEKHLGTSRPRRASK